MVSFRILSIAALCGLGIAHPGEHHDAAKRRRDLHHNEVGIRNAEAALARCKGTQTGQTMARRAAVRRAAKAAELREKRDIEHSRSSHLFLFTQCRQVISGLGGLPRWSTIILTVRVSTNEGETEPRRFRRISADMSRSNRRASGLVQDDAA